MTLYEFDDQFRCIRRIDAKEVKWREGKWFFYNGALRDFDESGSVRTTTFQEKEFPLKEDWTSFQKTEQKSEEMGYSELRTYIQKIQSSGYDATRYWVDLYSKLSYPLLNLIMVWWHSVCT